MSLVATGGGLIFGGDTNGHFRAFDQENGKVLWDMNLGSPVTGYPITYAVQRQAVCCGQHRQFAGQFGAESPGSGLEAEQREQHFGVRAAGELARPLYEIRVHHLESRRDVEH